MSVHDAVSGAAGGMAALCFTYPLAVAKVRLQSQAKQKQKLQQKKQFVNKQQSLEISVADSEESGADEGEVLNDGLATKKAVKHAHRVASSASVRRTHYRGALHCIKSIIQEQGLTGLYAGMRAAMMQKGAEKFAFFYAISLVSRLLNRSGSKPTKIMSLLQGMVAAFFSQLVMMPVEMVVVRSQSALPGESTRFRKTLASIVNEGGVSQLWSGLVPNTVLCINPGINSLVQSVLARDPSRSGSASRSRLALENFAIGFISKLIASCITYPLVVIKVRMLVAGRAVAREAKQLKASGGDDDATQDGTTRKKSRALSMAGTIELIYSEGGISGFYKGLKTQLTNAVLNEAITNLVRKELAPESAN